MAVRRHWLMGWCNADRILAMCMDVVNGEI